MKRLRTIAFLSIIGGLLVHLAVFTFIHIEAPVGRNPHPRAVPVEYAGHLDRPASPAFREQAALLDGAPLFMPTRWNAASQMSEVGSLREATEIFEVFAPDLALPYFTPDPPLEGIAPEGSPDDPLPSGPAFVLSRFGRSLPGAPAARSRGPAIRIRPLDQARSQDMTSRTLSPALASSAPPVLWDPCRFYVLMDKGIPVGSPLLDQSSGFPDWDEALAAHLSSLSFYRWLPDGYYLLTVFP
ncbi:MAG: hypothetical protein ACP5I4_06765 [Oceanipulchritudo sp.]